MNPKNSFFADTIQTQRDISVPLLKKAQGLIDTYLMVENEFKFKVMSNQQYNSYLKAIGYLLEFD